MNEILQTYVIDTISLKFDILKLENKNKQSLSKPHWQFLDI